MHIKRNVEYTQAYGCQLCVHIGSVAVMFGKRDGAGRRLELFTPRHLFRYSPGLKRSNVLAFKEKV